jgi:hypothetical protein
VVGERRWPPAYTLVAILLSSLTTGVLAIVISTHGTSESIMRIEENRRASDRALCGVVVTLDDSYRQIPPTTPAGKNLAVGLAELRRDLHCTPR